MATQRLILTGFDGGISANTKTGLPNSARFVKNLDIFTDDNSATLNPGATKVSGSTVTDLIKWIDSTIPYSTDRYFYGGANIYKETSGGVWSLDRTIGSGSPNGQGLKSYKDYLYYVTSTTLGRLGPFSGTPAYSDDFLSDGTVGHNVDANVNNTGQTYTTPTSIAETSANKVTWKPQYDPLKAVVVTVAAKGTGDWTVTVHDSNNTSLGTATITNINMVVGQVAFTFATPIRMLIGSTYHFHVTSTVNDGTVTTGTASDLSTASYKTYFGILIGDSNYHPIARFTNGVNGTMIIGNDHYFAQYDPFTGVYNPNQISIEPGYTIRAFVKDSESYLVGLAWKGSTIDGEEQGMAYYWDGIAPYYNTARPITGGMPNSGVNFKNRVFTVLGSTGELNIGTDPFRKIQPVPTLALGKKIEVTPGGIDVWRSKAEIAVGINTDDSSGLIQGVYEYGNQSDKAISYTSATTEVLALGYTISTGTTQGTGLQIGAVKAFGKDFYICWKDGSNYGVDKVTKTGNAAATASWESLIVDHTLLNNQLVSAPLKQKLAIKVVVKFNTLPSGTTVAAKYKLNREASWHVGTATTSASSDPTRAEVLIGGIGGARYCEAEFGFDITSSGAYVTITSVYFEFDPLENERFDN